MGRVLEETGIQRARALHGCEKKAQVGNINFSARVPDQEALWVVPRPSHSEGAVPFQLGFMIRAKPGEDISYFRAEGTYRPPSRALGHRFANADLLWLKIPRLWKRLSRPVLHPTELPNYRGAYWLVT